MIDWNRITDEYGPMVWRTAYRILASTEDSQDCLQQVFLAALEISRTQRIRNWGGLFRRLATTKAIDILRQRIRHRDRHQDVAQLSGLADKSGNPLVELQAEELATRLREALGQLPARHAEVFALRCFEQMSYREIAKALRLKTNAVGVLLTEARSRLQELLGSSDEVRTE